MGNVGPSFANLARQLAHPFCQHPVESVSNLSLNFPSVSINNQLRLWNDKVAEGTGARSTTEEDQEVEATRSCKQQLLQQQFYQK